MATSQHASSVSRLRRGRLFATPFSLFSRGRAFTVIEMVGVLAIIAFLASATLPKMIRKMDRAVWEKEKADQQAMVDALTASILHTKTVTNYTGIPSAIAKEMALSASSITNTPRGWARAFLVDPSFTIGGGKSYTQTTNGTARPLNARIMFLASIAGNLPVTNSDNNTDFQAIWDTQDGAKPSTTNWNNWTGRGEDLLIKKIDLEPLFYQLLLVDHDGTSQATYAIDDKGPMAADSGPGTQAYYLDGTVLGLTNSTGNLQTRYLLRRNISFLYEAGAWRGEIQGAGIQTHTTTNSLAASNFVYHANTFYTNSINPGASSQSASQTSVLIALYTFMFDYVFWATECPHFDYHGNSVNNLAGLPEYIMLDDMGASGQTGGNGINGFAGQNGLLK